MIYFYEIFFRASANRSSPEVTVTIAMKPGQLIKSNPRAKGKYLKRECITTYSISKWITLLPECNDQQALITDEVPNDSNVYTENFTNRFDSAFPTNGTLIDTNTTIFPTEYALITILSANKMKNETDKIMGEGDVMPITSKLCGQCKGDDLPVSSHKKEIPNSFRFRPGPAHARGTFSMTKSLITYDQYKTIMFWGRDVTLNVSLILGILSNIFIIIIVSTVGKEIGKSLKIYIISQAILDNLQSMIKIYINVVAYWRDRYPTWGSYVYVISTPYIHKYVYFATRGAFFWVILIICCQRCYAVFLPLKVKTAFVTRRPKIAVGLSVLLHLALFAINMVRYDYIKVFNVGLNATIYQDTTVKFDKNMPSMFLPIVKFVVTSYVPIPITLVAMTSIADAIKIKVVKIKRQQLVAAGTLHQTANDVLNKNERLTQTIIALATTSILCNSLTVIIATIMIFFPEIFVPNNLFLFQTLLFLSTIPHGLYSVLGFIILMLGSSAFKQHCIKLCAKCRRQ